MQIYSYAEALPTIGRTRAFHTGRAWFLMEDGLTGRTRLTDDPNPSRKEEITAVFSPVDSDPNAAA